MKASARIWLPAAMVACSVSAAQAETPRELLTEASFRAPDKTAALRDVGAAHSAATALLRGRPNDREAALMQATALGYRAKLTGSRSDAIAARRAMEALVARAPADPERHLALGAWHMGAVNRLGRLVARAALGASKPAGLTALDRAVAQGGNRALFAGFAALLRLQIDPGDARARSLAEAAARAAAPTPLDRRLQHAARAVLAQLRAGDANATRRLASRLLPFGHLDQE